MQAHRTLPAMSLLFSAVLALASSSVSGADIVKCVDANGRITLTDGACQGAVTSEVVVVSRDEAVAAPADAPEAGDQVGNLAAPASAPAAEPVYAPERSTYVPAPVRRALVVAKRSGPAGSLARDVATLKIARLNMILRDNEAQALRAQKLVAMR